MDGFKWHKCLEIGLEEIDSDHRQMVAAVDEVRRAIERNHLTECCRLVDAFIDLCKQHFESEEALLARLGYPDLDEHRSYHRALEEQATRLKATCDREIGQKAIERCYMETLDLLVDDIVRGDSHFKSFLEAKGLIERS